MIGMSVTTGHRLEGLEHLRQSVRDILTTPIGSRIARRDYGSHLPDLIDQPMNGLGQMRLKAATALALMRWEPRLRLTSVTIQQAGPAGSYALVLDGVRLDVPAATAATRLSLPFGSLTAR